MVHEFRGEMIEGMGFCSLGFDMWEIGREWRIVLVIKRYWVMLVIPWIIVWYCLLITTVRLP